MSGVQVIKDSERQVINLAEEIENWNASAKLVEIQGWVGKVPLRSRNPILLVTAPQQGKTRAVVWSFMDIAKPGWLLVYSVSSHAEAASVIKHYINYQQQHGWSNSTILLAYAGLNRFCPHYPQIKQLRKEKGAEFKQTTYCRANCNLWNTKPFPSKWFQYCNLANLDKCNIKLIMTPFNFRVLKRFYPNEAKTAGKHILLVGHEEDLNKTEGNVNKITGCIRAVLMKKLVDLTSRNRDGTLRGKKRRSLLSGPAIVVLPHELLPLVLAFARAYAARVILVIDEFDRMLSKKVPRWLAERYQRIGKPREWPWYKHLDKYLDKTINKDEEDVNYSKKLPLLINIRKIISRIDENNIILSWKAVEVPLITIVTLKLEELRKKSKLTNIIIVGSSIPLLPKYVLAYLIRWMAWAKGARTVAVYYSKVRMPKNILEVPYVDPDKLLLIARKVRGDVMVVKGSKNLAVNLASTLLLSKYNLSIKKIIHFKRPVSMYEFYKIFSKWCSNNKGRYEKDQCWFGRNVVTWSPGYKQYKTINGIIAMICCAIPISLNLPKTYIKIGNILVTWLGSRATRGTMLPSSVKALVIDTWGKAKETRKGYRTGLTVKEVENLATTADVTRYLDLLQALFRVNSRPDVVVVATHNTLSVLKQTIEHYNKRIDELAYI